MNYLQATILVNIQNQAEAKQFFGDGVFNTLLSKTGELPATHAIACGPFNTDEVERFASTATFKCSFKFGDFSKELLEANELFVIQQEV